MPADPQDLIAPLLVALGIAALFGIHLTVVLTDIRRELRRIRLAVNTTTHAVRAVADQRAFVVALDPDPVEEEAP